MVAEKKLPSVQPFRPSKIHNFYRWVDRLPGPSWFYYAGIVVVAGLLNNAVAWREQVLAPGEINMYYGLTAFFIGYYLFANDILLRVARESLIEFQPLLGIPGASAIGLCSSLPTFLRRARRRPLWSGPESVLSWP